MADHDRCTPYESLPKYEKELEGAGQGNSLITKQTYKRQREGVTVVRDCHEGARLHTKIRVSRGVARLRVRLECSGRNQVVTQRFTECITKAMITNDAR